MMMVNNNNNNNKALSSVNNNNNVVSSTSSPLLLKKKEKDEDENANSHSCFRSNNRNYCGDGEMLMHTPSGTKVAVDQLVRGPYEYILQIPGKGFRGKMIDFFNLWLNVESETVEKVKLIVDKLHNASLLIDDIEDSSTLRRGVPVAHAVFGIPMTINAANFIYFEALQDTRKLGNFDAMDVFMTEIMRLHRGQGMDIYWRDNNICPTFEEYQQMVLDKTGGLFRLSVGLMQAFSGDKRDFSHLCNDLGLVYQIMDDYLNLQSENYHKNKSFAEDLTEGKFSFPIIHAIKEKGDETVFHILKQRTKDKKLKMFAIERMRGGGAFEFTLKTLNDVHRRLLSELEALGGNPGLEKLISYWFQQLPPLQSASDEGQAADVMAPFEPHDTKEEEQNDDEDEDDDDNDDGGAVQAKGNEQC